MVMTIIIEYDILSYFDQIDELFDCDFDLPCNRNQETLAHEWLRPALQSEPELLPSISEGQQTHQQRVVLWFATRIA